MKAFISSVVAAIVIAIIAAIVLGDASVADVFSTSNVRL